MRAPLVTAVVVLAAGIAAGVHRPVPPGSGPFVIGGALALALWAAAATWRRRPAPWTSQRAVLLLFLLAGGLLGTAARTASDRSCIRRIPEGRELVVQGRVVERVPGGRLRLRIERIEWAGRGLRCEAVVAARLEPEADLRPGAALGARGRWWSPPGARPLLERPGALVLDTAWLRPGGTAGVGARLRGAARARVDAVFPRRAPLAASLLLAQRAGVDPDLRDRYARAGLSHLLAISGLHVGLLAGLLLLLTRALRLSPRSAAGWASAGTGAYVALIGAPHSAVRAALQITLVLAARFLQRPARPEALMAAAALGILAADPGALVRPGFQLSFGGVAGILALRPPLLRALDHLTRVRVRGRPVGRWMAEGLATSAAATLATAPMVAWHFGRVPVVGVLANLVAIPLLAAALPALVAALAAGLLWIPAGRFLAGGAELLLGALDTTATAASAVPLGSVTVTPAEVVPLTGAVLAGWWASRRLGQVRGVVRAAVWGAAGVAVLTGAPLRLHGDRVEIHHIDVGQGDATAIRSPAGRWILVDAGVATDDYDAGARRVVPYLQGRGARRLAGLVITHPDADHMGGAAAVLRALRPAWAGGPGTAAGKARYLDLLDAARRAGVPWAALRRGTEIELDGVTVTVLSPEGEAESADANAASVVLLVAYGEFQALLPGDAPAEVENRLVRAYGRRLEAEVLKVGHHGSATSTTADLLTATGVGAAVISVGRGNRYGHPDRGVLARIRSRGIEVFRTDRDGSIVVRGKADGTWAVETERRALP